MNKFNEYQQRLWKNMVSLIDSYLKDNITFSELVSNLHGSIQVGEFKDQELVKKWYEYWGALEIHNAVAIDKNIIPKKDDVINDVENLRKFLVEQLETQKKE